jgi:pyruvate kinase
MIIISTVGHTSLTEDKIVRMILAGTDILRFNFSYKIMRENYEHIQRAQHLIEELNSTVKILIDFPLNKIRLGDFDIKVYSVRENDIITLKSAPFSPDCHQFIPIDIDNLGKKVYIDQVITIGDGEVSIQIIEILNNDTIKAKVLNNGMIHYMKTINCGHFIDDEALLNIYKDIIKNIELINPDYVAVSYVNSIFNEKIKQIINESSISPKVILKIEKGIEENELEKICTDNYYRKILIDRGEMGVNLPYEKLMESQKKIIKTAKKFNKPVIVSTQILESTITNFIPSRADVLDLANIVMDGASGIMFCMETASTLRPAYTISVAKKIIFDAERYKDTYEK